MAESSYLSRAIAGLSDMSKALDAAIPGARVAADDEDLPTDARPALREAVAAVEHARKKAAQAAQAVARAKKYMEDRSAQ